MKWHKLVFDFYLDASIHVALVVYALVQITFQTLNISSNNHYSFFIFFGSISCYNFIKYGVEAEKYILVSGKYQKVIQVLSIVSLGFALYHVHFLSFKVWLGVSALILLTGLYALPILPKSKNLRSWGGLKIFVVALVWSGATVILPVISANQEIEWDFGVETFQRFLFVLILLVPFEIRDLAYDKAELKTLPQSYGVANTKFFGAFATLIFFFSTFLKDDLSSAELIIKGTLFLILGMMLYTTKRNQSKYYASFWVEAIPILWFVLLVVFERLFTVYPEIALSF